MLLLGGKWGGTDLSQDKRGYSQASFAFALSAVGGGTVPNLLRRALRELILNSKAPPALGAIDALVLEADVETERESKRHRPGKVLPAIQTIIKMCPPGSVFQPPHPRHPAAPLIAGPACVNHAVSS